MRRLTGVLTFLIVLSASPATAGAAAPGGFSQLPSPLGCIQNGGDNVTCRPTPSGGLVSPFKVAVSPDGKNVYQASVTGGLTIYNRDASTGALTQKTGTAGCIHDGAATATCAGATAFQSPNDVAVSPDGETVWVVATSSNAVATFTRHADGTLTQKSGLDGCVADNNGSCRDAQAMDFPYDLSVSPDGNTVYVASFNSGSVTALVATSDGVLREPSASGGFFGCVANTAIGTCGLGRALGNAIAVAASSDGANVYASTLGSSVVALQRNSAGLIKQSASTNACATPSGTPTCSVAAELGGGFAVATRGNSVFVGDSSADTVVSLDRQSGGGIVRHPGASGCVSNGARVGCTAGRGLAGVQGLTTSPDGLHLYANGSTAVVELRLSGSAMTPNPGSRGCVQTTSTPTCQRGTALGSGFGITVSPDGRSIYASQGSTHAIAVFKRDSAPPACSNNSATVQAGSVTALALTCGDFDSDALTRSITAPPNLGVLGNVNQGAGTVTFASSGVAGTTTFRFRATSNGVPSNEATFTINIVGSVAPPAPPPPPPPPPKLAVQSSTASFSTLAFPKFTKFVNLSANNLPRNATVTVTCKTKKKKQQKKGCPFKSKRFKNGRKAKLNLRKAFKNKRVPVKAKITITITASGFVPKRITYTIRKNKRPKSLVQCISPSGKVSSCSRFS